MEKILKYEKFISEIEKSLGIKLFQYEREYLNALLEAKKRRKKIIINRARKNSHSFSRIDLIYSLIVETQNKLEEYVLYGNDEMIPKGILADIRKGK